MYRERRSQGRVRNLVPGNQWQWVQKGFQVATPHDRSSVVKKSHDPAIQTELVLTGTGHEKPPVQSDASESSSRLTFKLPPNAIPPLEYRRLQFGTLSPVSAEVPSREHGQRSGFPIYHSQGSGLSSPASSSLRPAMSSDKER